MNVKLLVVHGRPKGKSLQFPHGEFVFGRGHECHVRPNSEWVSRQHCLLRVTENTVHLCDLGSTNGTLVNGRLVVHEQPLHHGDLLQVGPLVFEVVVEDDPCARLPLLPLPRPETREVCLDTDELPALGAGPDTAPDNDSPAS